MTNVQVYWEELLDPANAAHAHEIFARMRETAAFVKVSTNPGYTHWWITRYDECVDLIKNNALLAKNPQTLPPDVQARMNLPAPDPMIEAFNRMMVMLDPPDHTRLRGLVQKAFTPRMVEELRPRVQQIADDLVDRLEEQSEFDLIDDFAAPAAVTVIAEMMGVPVEDQANFRRWADTIVRNLAGFDLQMIGPEIQQAAFEFMIYMNNMIDQRREVPRDDLISALIYAREVEDSLTHEELLGMIFLLLTAGHETTLNMLGNGVLALLQHPDQLALLRANPPLIRPAVEEMMRYDGSAKTAADRWMRQTLEVDGGTMQPGDLVSVGLLSANRDPRKFANPDVFDITRDPNPHIALGGGIHYCIGAPLARIEASLMIQTLVTRLPKLRLAQDPATLPWLHSMLVHGVSSARLATE